MPTPKALERFASQVLEVMPFMVREFARREDNDLTRGKISCPQMVALHHAAEEGEVKVSEIAKLLSINKSSASVLLDRLIRQKLMSRRQDNKDRRVVWVGITPQGRKVISQIMGQKRQSIKAIFGPLTPRERHQYLSVLLKVKTHLAASCAMMVLAVGLFQACDAHAFLWFGKSQKSESPATQRVAAIETPPAENTPLSLQEAYRLALKRSESVAITAEEINQAQARFYHAFDYFLPTVSFKMTRFDQDTRGLGGSGVLNSSRPSTPEKKFVFSQPLFSGFKEIAALQGTGADKKQQKLAWKRAKELLFMDVTDSFYNVLQAEKDVEVLSSTHDLLSKRLADLGERVKTGKSRDSEGKSALSDLKLIESELVTSRSEVRVARNLLEFYIGGPLADRALEEESETALPGDAEALAKSKFRSDVLSDEQGYIVAQKGVIAANADLFPKIYVDGNYYTQRVGFQNGNDWDATLTFDVPVFEVGQTLGDIKAAAATREQARLKWQQTLRQAQLDIKDASDNWQAARESEAALKEADQAAKDNYDSLTEEYGHNLVNNLEVLDSLRRYQDTQRGHQAAHYTERKNYWKLRVAMSDVPEADA